MFTQLKKRSEGFTIVELLIVIVVIGILAALVLNTFQGVQARARDTERKTDINAIHTQLEVFYNDNGYYLAAASDLSVANLAGIDGAALEDPNQVTIGGAGGNYSYVPTPASCTNGGATPCASYALTSTLEGDVAGYTKDSLN